MPLPTTMNPGSPAARAYNAHQYAWKVRDDIARELRTKQDELEHARTFMQRPPSGATSTAIVDQMVRIPTHEQAIAELVPRLTAAEAVLAQEDAALTAVVEELDALKSFVQGRGPAPLDDHGRALTIEAARASYQALTGQTTDRLEEMAALEDYLEGDARKAWHPVLPVHTHWEAMKRYYDMNNQRYYTLRRNRGHSGPSLSERLLARFLDVHWGPAKVVKESEA